MSAAIVLTVILAFGVGVSLGLLGGGGSVLSVPLLVYVAGWEPHRAATGSLFIVGVTSLLSLVPHARAGRVRWRTGLVFGLGGMAGAYLGGLLSAMVPGGVLLTSFAVLMLATAAGMIRGSRGDGGEHEELQVAPALALGAVVGTATGFVGAGGGFVVVPALVLVAGLAMPAAVGTSLLVIAMQSTAGLAGHLTGVHLPWALTLTVTVSAVLGSLAGGRMTGRIPAPLLRRGFGVLVLAVATLVLVQQLPRPAAGHTRPWLGVAAPALVLLARRTRGTSHSRGIDTNHSRGIDTNTVTAVADTPGPQAIPPSTDPTGKYTQRGMAFPMPTDPPGREDAPGPSDRRSPMPATPETAPTAGTAGPESATPVASPSTAGTPAGSTSQGAPRGDRPSTMVFTQFYIDCLSQASYLVGDTSTGQAVIVDPRRDVQEYLDHAAAQGLRIVGMVNTHFHADFLSGHLELAKATGAWIGYGQGAQAEFETRPLHDGERISLGDVTLEIMETPGHTPESVSVLVYEHADDEVAYGVLTGDALFIGDVGRPDLLASIGFTPEQLGRQLFQSIQGKLMGLPNPVRVFPGHGAGSACGKNLSTALQSTIGEQRALNYACRPMPEEEFLALVTAGQPSAPEYFVYDAVLNRKQREVFDADTEPVALDNAALDAALARGAAVLDARDAMTFAAGHLPGALNVPADGRFAETAGMVLTGDAEIILIAPPGRHTEVAVRLARIGFDKVAGYLPDPDATLLAHADTVQRGSRLTAGELAAILDAGRAGTDAQPQPVVVDVRNIGERETGHLTGSIHIPLAELRRRIGEVPTGRPVVTYCAGGWRSSVAASLLRRNGFEDVSDLIGGYAAWQSQNEPLTA